jgi:hypothetical protein
LALVRTDVSEERIAFIRVKRFSELRTLAVSSNRKATLMMEEIFSSETSVFTRAARLHIPEDGILHVSDFVCGLPLALYLVWCVW